ncbi:hypothetical protein QR680_013728 [Steinernema hermaphroditum]|uniref:Uncharacterized protein n=1 Tax=Steinernema hermaphroditum TaxID=289476 RepID=A0AA39I7W4_9BILA|nr:hypothetical protein QR680_013728 [Steinernema hermaphroditum]
MEAIGAAMIKAAGAAASIPYAGPVAVAVGATLAAPYAIPAAAVWLGFGAGGVVAGSTAAGMMSLGAGTTPLVVSTLQSIGATGAISASSSVLSGAVTGGAAAVGKAIGLF